MVDYDYTVCAQVPTLHCKNGSSCTPGIASFGTNHDHLDLQTQDSGYHCKCKTGFIGHQCEIPVDECVETSASEGPPSCYHGSKCQSNGSSVSCDCNKLNESSGSTDTKFAGAMCQHESTSFCAGSLVGNHSPNHQFCTNHGTCVKMVMGGELHPGCECKSGWLGDHCEIRQDPFAKVASAKSEEGGGSGAAGKVLFSLLIIAIIAVASGIAFVIIKGRKRSSFESSAVAFQGEMSVEKTVVGDGDLDPDGSGTLGSPLGSPSKDGNGVADNDLVMQDEEENSASDSEDGPTSKVGPQTEIV